MHAQRKAGMVVAPPELYTDQTNFLTGHTSSGSSPSTSSWLVSTPSPRNGRQRGWGHHWARIGTRWSNSPFRCQQISLPNLHLWSYGNQSNLDISLGQWHSHAHEWWSIDTCRLFQWEYWSSLVNPPSRPWATRSISKISTSVSGDHTSISLREESPMASITYKGITVSASSWLRVDIDSAVDLSEL